MDAEAAGTNLYLSICIFVQFSIPSCHHIMTHILSLNMSVFLLKHHVPFEVVPLFHSCFTLPSSLRQAFDHVCRSSAVLLIGGFGKCSRYDVGALLRI